MDVGVAPSKLPVVVCRQGAVLLVHRHSAAVRRVAGIQGLCDALAARSSLPHHASGRAWGRCVSQVPLSHLFLHTKLMSPCDEQVETATAVG